MSPHQSARKALILLRIAQDRALSPNIQTNNEDVWLTFADDERLDDQKGRSETVDHQQSARLGSIGGAVGRCASPFEMAGERQN
jgi:hypothetical protein